jgi:hypothetical protein
MTDFKKIRWLSIVAALAVLFVFAAPASAQYQIYDLGINITTQDIRADSTGTVHLIWTNGGNLYYGKIVNNAVTGQKQLATKVSTRFWRPLISVRPDGSTVHVTWCQGGGFGNKVMHTWRSSAGTWKTQTAYTAPSTKQISMPACAVDGNGQVHLLFGVYNTSPSWFTLFYKKRSAAGKWGALVAFAPKTPEHTFPMLTTDSTGRVHATWCVAGNLNGSRNDAYYCTAASGGTLKYSTKVKIPKGPGITLNGFGELYVDANGVVHRSIGGWSGSLQKMCIDHSKKPSGGTFSVPTRASIDFLDLGACDPVPAVVAGEDGSAVVAWGHVKKDGSNEVMASFYDPSTKEWNLTTVDPTAGIPPREGAYRVAMTRTDRELYGVWRASTGHLNLFVMPISIQNNSLQPGIVR